MDTITTNTQTDHTSVDHAGVNCYPPKVLFGMLLLSLLLDVLVPLPLGFGLVGLVMGFVFASDALFLIMFSARTLKKAGTNVPPNRPTHAIVSDGIYRFTRNPIYVGFVLGHTALALLFDSLWLAAMLPAFFLYIDRYVIPREEAYLTRKFGEEYTTYRTKVRRWF